MIAFDTNLLVYAHRLRYAEHDAAVRTIQKASEEPGGFGIPLPCIAEFSSIVTHPSGLGRPSTGEETHLFLDSLISETGAEVWLPITGFWSRLLRLATDLRVSGKRIFDLQIALIAFENGATEIWTHDRNFTRIPGLRVHDPL
jgi:toxin-antitoxin system PIN domain toxin